MIGCGIELNLYNWYKTVAQFKDNKINYDKHNSSKQLVSPGCGSSIFSCQVQFPNVKESHSHIQVDLCTGFIVVELILTSKRSSFMRVMELLSFDVNVNCS